jgi:hypothetical protein
MRGAFLEREPAERVVVGEPVVGRADERAQDAGRVAHGEVLGAVALQREARVRDHRGREVGLGRQVGEEIIRERHGTDLSKCSCFLISRKHSKPGSDATSSAASSR